MAECNALVTGGTSGIGLATARGLARAGCGRIALFSRGRRPVEPALRELKSLGVEAIHVKGDLTRSGDVESLIPRLVSEWGWLDVVAMSYGNPSCEPCGLEDHGWGDWLEAASMYLASTGVIARDLARINPRLATMIIFSSFTVNEPHPPLFIADTVRLGLKGLVRILARMAPGRVRPILVELGSFKTPGAVETVSRIARGAGFEEYWRRHVEGLSPLKRSGGLEELEELVGLLVRAPGYLTGAVIRFDGASTPCI